MTDPVASTVTIVNGASWGARVSLLASMLSRADAGSVIPDLSGRAADPELTATVTHPTFWANAEPTLAEALLSAQGPTSSDDGGVQASGASSAANSPGRLTLTVEEAAALLGISRAFAYDAVRRGEIPSLRIGRRVLVPRVALERLVDVSLHDHSPPIDS